MSEPFPDEIPVRLDIAPQASGLEVNVRSPHDGERERGVVARIKAALACEADGIGAPAEPLRELLGWDARGAVLLPIASVLTLYAKDKQVHARTAVGSYRVRATLAELEPRLRGARFLRISRSEIANFAHVRRLDFSIGSTIGLEFSDGSRTWVARRHMANIKRELGVK